MNIELVDKTAESDEVEAFIFEIKAIPQAEEIQNTLKEKIEQKFLDEYGLNDAFAVECAIQRVNSVLKSLVLELRIKAEQVSDTRAAELIEKAVRSLV